MFAPRPPTRRLSVVVILRITHVVRRHFRRCAITRRPARHQDEDANERRDKWANCFGSSCTRHTPATTERNSHAGRPCRTVCVVRGRSIDVTALCALPRQLCVATPPIRLTSQDGMVKFLKARHGNHHVVFATVIQTEPRLRLVPRTYDLVAIMGLWLTTGPMPRSNSHLAVVLHAVALIVAHASQ